jgi:peptidoglycan/xylan/chitin deacetylase (PgdA/CDA1 family)
MRPLAVVAALIVGLGGVVAAVVLVGSQGSDSAKPTGEADVVSTTIPRRQPQYTTVTNATGRPTSDPVPILMYHVVADPPAGAAFPELYVGKAAFAGEMDWLARHGFHGVTLHDVLLHWQHGAPLPAHPIVVSFDDGYRSQAVTAAPILHDHGWPGVINLTVRNTTDFWGLPPARVRALMTEGWEVAAHSETHPDLTKVDDAQLREEVAGSRAKLRGLFNAPVEFFCYPAGRLDERVVAAVRDAGYSGATTTALGLGTPADMFRLARIRINRSDGVGGLAEKLRSLGVTA